MEKGNGKTGKINYAKKGGKMPKEIDNIPLTAKEHRQWKRVLEVTGDGGQATEAVRKSRRSKKKKK